MQRCSRILTIGLLILVSIFNIYGAVWRPEQNDSSEGFEYRIVESSPHRTVIRVEILSADTGSVEIDGQIFNLFHVDGLARSGEIGKPLLPVFSRLVAARNGEIRASISEPLFSHIDNFRPFPVQPPRPDIHGYLPPPFQLDKAVYSSNDPYPSNSVSIGSPVAIRGIQGARITVYPVRYHPNENRLQIMHSFTLILHHDPPKSVPERLVSPLWSEFLGQLFLNPLAMTMPDHNRRPASPTGAELLIISDPAFFAAAESLVIWKKLFGIDAEVKYTTETGTSSSDIQNYVQNAYDTWSPAPEYLLILGDAENVAPYYAGSHPYSGTPTGTDLYYATVDGADYYPDIFYGRLPAQSPTEAMKMVLRIIDYERVTYDLGASFYNSAACCAYFQDNDANGYADRRFTQTSEEIRDYLVANGYDVDRLYNTDSHVNPTNWNNGSFGDGSPIPTELLRPTFPWDADEIDIRNAINQGRFLVTHRDHGYRGGWGDPPYAKGDIAHLSNGAAVPVVMSYNCMSGWFDNETDDPSDGTSDDDECFCEVFIRKSPGGTVGIIGATRVSYSGFNDYLARGFIDGIWGDFDGFYSPLSPTESRTGPALVWGKIYMEDNWGSGDIAVVEFEMFEWFGDPTMRLFTEQPDSITVTLPTHLSEGTISCDIPCDTEGALVTFMVDGEITDRSLVSGGIAHMNFDMLHSTDTVLVAVTDQNRIPFLGQIPVLYAAHVTITPDTLVAMIEDSIVLDVLDTLDVPYSGVTVTVNGFTLAETLITGPDGHLCFNITPPYAEELRVIGERPGGGVIFNKGIVVLGGMEFNPVSVEAGTPGALVDDSLAIDMEGYVRAELPSSPFRWKLSGGGIDPVSGFVSTGDTLHLSVTPLSQGPVLLETAAESLAIGKTVIRAAICYGPLDGVVRDSSGTLVAANIDILVFNAGADTSIDDPVNILQTNSGGFFDGGDRVPCRNYNLYPVGFGWKNRMVPMTHNVDGDYEIRLARAPSGMMTGNVTDPTGGPLHADIALLHPWGRLLRRSSSDSSGSYEIDAVPEFGYQIAAFARGYKNYFADCPVDTVPFDYPIIMQPVEANVLLISIGGGSASDTLESHLLSFGLTVDRLDHIPSLDTMSAYEFVLYSTGGNTDTSTVAVSGMWDLLDAHRHGVKLVFEGGDMARNLVEATSLPLIILDSLFMISSYLADGIDTSITLTLSPGEAYSLAHVPDIPPRTLWTVPTGTGTRYLDLVRPKNSGLLYSVSGSPGQGLVCYYSDSLYAGVHRMAYMFFKYDEAIFENGANKPILRNIVEWMRAPDFEHSVLSGRTVVSGGDPGDIEVNSGTGIDTTQSDGYFTVINDPGMFHLRFSAPHINDTIHYGITLDPGEIRVGYLAILSASHPVAESPVPVDFEITAVHPNPFNGVVSFEISTDYSARIELAIYDIDGRMVDKIEKTIDREGTIVWETSSHRELPSGIYLYRLSSENDVFNGRIIMVK